jgi:hypothetical protein
MSGLSSDPAALAGLAGLAAFLMTVSGLSLKRLRLRVGQCPVCHHPKPRCTCHWL